MKAIEKEKLCISCEGRIPLDANVCLHCSAQQVSGHTKNSFQAPIFQNQTLEDSLTSLYTPPYQGKLPLFNTDPQEETLFPQTTMNFDQETPHYKEVTKSPQLDPLFDAVVEEEETPQKSSLVPTILLVLGANLAVIGLMLLFFSKNGVLRLEWDANYWFFYFLVSAPLIYFGMKKVKLLD